MRHYYTAWTPLYFIGSKTKTQRCKRSKSQKNQISNARNRAKLYKLSNQSKRRDRKIEEQVY